MSLDSNLWTVTGSWSQLLANVTRLWIAVELVNNNSGCGSGAEVTATDNISLWSCIGADWANHRAGWPGAQGIPRLSLSSIPRLGPSSFSCSSSAQTTEEFR